MKRWCVCVLGTLVAYKCSPYPGMGHLHGMCMLGVFSATKKEYLFGASGWISKRGKPSMIESATPSAVIFVIFLNHFLREIIYSSLQTHIARSGRTQ